MRANEQAGDTNDGTLTARKEKGYGVVLPDYEGMPSANRHRMYLVVIVVAFSQGILGLADLSLNYLYKDDFHMHPADTAFIAGIASLPWIIKPLWGFISDCLYFFGYRRKSYLVFFGICGFFGWTALSRYATTMNEAILLVLFIQLGVAFCNAIGEALLVEISQDAQACTKTTEDQKQSEASKNVSLFFGVRSFGYLLTTYTGGLLLTMIAKRQILAITSLFPLTLALFALTLPEKKQQPHEPEEVIALKDEGSADESKGRSLENLKRVYGFMRFPAIWKPILFIFLYQITPSPSSAMFFFYTNELKFHPEFMGKIKFVQAVANIMGIMIYHRFLKTMPFKRLFTYSGFAVVFCSMTQILLVTRYNTKLGIPDQVFCLTDSLIIQTINEINMFPILVMCCRFCPKNIEGTMYAILMAVLNSGSMLSMQLGGIATRLFGITDTNFDNLWKLILLANMTTFVALSMVGFVNFEAAQECVDTIKSTEDDAEEKAGLLSSAEAEKAK